MCSFVQLIGAVFWHPDLRMWLRNTFKQNAANSNPLKSGLRQSQRRLHAVTQNYFYWGPPSSTLLQCRNGLVRVDGKIKRPLPGGDTEMKIMSSFLPSLLLCTRIALVTLYWDVKRCGMHRQFPSLRSHFPKRTTENGRVWSHLFLEEILPVLQGSQPVLLVLMFQVLIRGMEVADEVLQTQAHRLDGQVNGGCLCFLAESIQAPESIANTSLG